MLGGAAAFKLYDTFGLALDEQEEMAREFGLQIDREGFDAEMEQQRERARASWKGAEKTQVAPVYQELLPPRAHEIPRLRTLEPKRRVVALLSDQQAVDELPAGAKANWCSTSTPFYAEAGGQVGDHGALYREDGRKGRGRRSDVRAGAGPDRPSGRDGHMRSPARALIGRGRIARRAIRRCGITPRRICCTRRFAMCSART